MKRAKLNLIIDLLLFILLLLITSLGLLIHFVLVPGFKSNLLYNKPVDLSYWGMDRHQWGEIHLIISWTFIALIVIHLFLHWKPIACVAKQMIKNRIALILAGVSILMVSALLIAGIFSIRPKIKERAKKEQYQKNQS